jgi:hypothetical protein
MKDEELGRESEDAEIMALLTQYIPTLDDTTFSYSPSDDRSSTKRPMPTITLHHKQQHGGETSEHDTRAAVATTATKRRSPSFLPCPIPIRQAGTSRSMFNRTIKNDPIESIILADAIAEAAKCEHSLTDDEASHHSDFLLSLPSDATASDATAAEQQNIIPRRTVSALQDERRKRFSFKPRSTPPLEDDVDEHHVTSLATVGANNSTLFSFGTPPISSSSYNLKSHETNWGDEMMKLSHKLTNFDSNVMQFEGSSSDSSDNDNNNDIIQSPSPPSSLLLFDLRSNKSSTTMLSKFNNNLNSSPGVLLNDWTTTTPAGIYQQEIFTTPPTTMI